MKKLTTKSMLGWVIPAVLILVPASLTGQTSRMHMARSDRTSSEKTQACRMMQMMGSEGMSGGMMGSGMSGGMMGSGRKNNQMSSSGMMMGSPMMRAMRFLPARILELRDELSLQPKQVTELEGLQAAMSAVRQAAMVAAPMLLEQLSEAFERARPDSAAVGAAAEQMLQRHNRMTVSMWTTSAAVKAILTTKQLERLAQMSGHMGHMSKRMHSDSGHR
ncbi:MAG: hypothetical protein ACE5HT_05415 [Gemmatimonadales bacterium]